MSDDIITEETRRENDERSSAILLEHMGIDGAKWAAEFRATAIKLGYSDMDEGWLIGWFANAIEAGRRAPTPTEPDYLYDPNDWEYTCDWTERENMTDDLPVGEIQRFSTLICGSDKWAARVVLERDKAGDPIHSEIRWFNNQAEAEAAVIN